MTLKRRTFIAGLGAAATWPLAARAQAMPVIGYLHPGSPNAFANIVAAFRGGLGETGYVEGRNVAIEYRWANYQFDKLPALAGDLVNRGVAVIAVIGSGAATLAAKAATQSIPIVFSTAADAVQSDLVGSLSRRGANVTGISNLGNELMTKRLGLLSQLVPGTMRLALLINPIGLGADDAVRDVHTAAARIGRQVEVVSIGSSRDLEGAFATISRVRAAGLLIVPNPVFLNSRAELVSLAAQHGVPAIYYNRGYTDIGGLMSYGPNPVDTARQVGGYVGRILRGARPSDLPVLQPTKFELIVNLKTAKMLGLTIPPDVLATADEVIE